ncbi:methylation-associated defense system restriction endonuclease subunit S MAD5 [Nocardia nova]|uniref:methylation-associated defense system restriction endonuclease subunit S MAD5 n=1 Tax=Nocardia nova TaxID=37330 RepID=UPI0007C66702|nr:hypothetical protein [Nocardia nova]
MKLVDFDNPVRSDWLTEQGSRLDCKPYISETYAAQMTMKRLPHTMRLSELTDRIFRPGIFRREWTNDPQQGMRFLSSVDILEADISNLPMLTSSSSRKVADLTLQPGWILITRSGMNAGRVTQSRPEMAGAACSEHVLRVIPSANIPAGYLYIFLSSRYGTAMIRGGVHGTSIKHIEPPHLVDIPVPRLGDEIEERINLLIQEAASQRSQYQTLISAATNELFASLGMTDMADHEWHRARDTGFVVSGLSPASLRALNFAPRALSMIDRLREQPHRTLGDICTGGRLRTGARFKRFEADPANGVRLVGQRQAFWMRPEGRWIDPKLAPSDILQEEETVLVAAHGTLGENEVYGRAIFVTGRSAKDAYSQDFLRIHPGPSGPAGAYLFAFLRSNTAFRILRSMSVGGKQQEYHPTLLRNLPIPLCSNEDQYRITEIVRRAYRHRDEAGALEDQAMALLEHAIREAAG